MGEQPVKMKIGMGLAFLGGIVSIVALAMAWNGTLDAAPKLGYAMLCAVLFFALAGCFSAYSPLKSSSVILLGVLALIAVAVAVYAQAFGWGFAILMWVCDIVAIFCAACPNTKRWIESNRII